MSDEKKNAATKEYVVVFDQVDVHTGEFRSQGVGMPQLAVAASYFRGQKVSLTDEQAKRLLDDGAVIAASDKRAKLIEEQDPQQRGVRRDVEASLGAVALEETPAATAGGQGAKRSTGTLGTKAELEKRSVTELKELAAQHGVTVERGMTKPKLAAALAKLRTADTDGDGQSGTDTEGTNPGQKSDESNPPEHQPDEPPEK